MSVTAVLLPIHITSVGLYLKNLIRMKNIIIVGQTGYQRVSTYNEIFMDVKLRKKAIDSK